LREREREREFGLFLRKAENSKSFRGNNQSTVLGALV